MQSDADKLAEWNRLMFEGLEDTSIPTGTFTIRWSKNGVGFGEFVFEVDDAGNVVCHNETMSKEFIKEVLNKMVDDCSLLS